MSVATVTTAQRARLLQREATREALIAAGIDALATHGLEGVKVANVAKHAGLANGTFYTYFTDRHDLYNAIVDRLVADLAKRLAAVHSTWEAGKSEVDRAEVEAFVDFVEQNPNFIGAFWAAGPTGRPMTLLVEQRETELRRMQLAGAVRSDIDLSVMARAEAYLPLAVLAWWDADRSVPRSVLVDSLVAYRKDGTRPTPSPSAD
ncbi:TetR/AcrR family transcriptional regulator [Subtercola sp. YIM 133946]|uniref:TetR/AcrR family transcriptional regulator n=1 Tax=Subtercola sp. YIM 133946 TaxID=3118909 RepID=UPI002F955C94